MFLKRFKKIRFILKDWPNDPFIKGSYHNIAPGQEDALATLQEYNGETVKTLFAPIDNTLFFAG
ncbi:MAG: hypothetical protein KC505_09495, partial [Myxococcales bacterium]|nr:hypothetical protein [Myxococcales bacterium]